MEEAVRDAIEATFREQSNDPLMSIGRRLLKQAGEHAPAPAVSAPAASANAPSDMLWSVKEAVEKKRERQGRRPASTTDLSDTAGKESSSPWGDFELQGWLESLNLVEPIESAVCHPLKQYFEAEEGVKNLGADPADGADAATGQQECKMDFLVSIGAHSSHEPLARMLHDQKLVDRLALMIWDGARKLRGGSGNGGAVDLEGHGGLVTKFFEDGDGRALQFGKLTTFYQGLDGFLGPPNPNLREAMEDEHTRQADSKLEFRVPNYKTQTTPRIEFWFVAEPTDARLAALGRTKEGWPKEPDLQTTPQPSLPTAGHEIATDRRAARQALEPRHFEGQLADRNARLREIGMEKILDDELIAARLYTGCAPCRSLPPSKRAALSLLLRVRDPSRGRR